MSTELVTSYTTLFERIDRFDDPINLLPTPLNDLYYLFSGRYTGYQDLNVLTPDGMPLVFYLKIRFKTKSINRLYGPEILLKVLKKYSTCRHLFLVSKEEGDRFVKQYGAKKQKCIELGFSKHGEDLITPKIEKKIISYKPDFIWIGVGSPKQVAVMKKIRSFYSGGHVFCVGAAFRLLTFPSTQAPVVLQKLSLEWLFRLILEPKRLWKRYFFDSPRGFLCLFKITNKINVLFSD